jgi:hypothetical protein
MVAHAFISSYQKAETGGSLRPAWSTESSRIARAIQRNSVFENKQTTTHTKREPFKRNVLELVAKIVTKCKTQIPGTTRMFCMRQRVFFGLCSRKVAKQVQVDSYQPTFHEGLLYSSF